jgi:hypothetical protein
MLGLLSSHHLVFVAHRELANLGSINQLGTETLSAIAVDLLRSVSCFFYPTKIQFTNSVVKATRPIENTISAAQ